jgi:glutaredoxin
VRRVTLLSRPGCHLCDDAQEVLDRVGEPYDVVDIESDDELFKRYLERIPVVVVDGEERFEYFVEESTLRRLLH